MIETTDFNKSEQYTLSIRLSTDGFSFSVFNPMAEGELTFYDHEVDENLSLTANLKQTFREMEWLSRPYRRVNILMADKRFTFIPLEFFEDEQAKLFSITITRSGKMNWFSTTSCKRTILSYSSEWTEAPVPFYASNTLM